MSTPISYVIDDAAQAIGDPNKQRVTLAQWVGIYNRSNRELCQKANVLGFSDGFTLVANQNRYEYPAGMTVMTAIHVTETPDDKTTFRVLGEYFEDEFRAMVDASYPAASLPTGYFATSSWFHLVPMVSAQIVGGGCITYYGLPDRITVDQVTGGTVIQVPDFAQDYLLRRMIVHGMEQRNRLVEARTALEMWNADMETLQDKLDDRSVDRRSTIAPRKNRFAGMR